MPNLAITIALESNVIGNIRADIALAGLGWVLRMGQKADRFGGFFAWVKKPTVLGGLQIQIRLDISDTDTGISEKAPAPLWG